MFTYLRRYGYDILFDILKYLVPDNYTIDTITNQTNHTNQTNQFNQTKIKYRFFNQPLQMFINKYNSDIIVDNQNKYIFYYDYNTMYLNKIFAYNDIYKQILNKKPKTKFNLKSLDNY
jgi:hypothetical protein